LEIIKVPPIIKLPKVPEYILGVINLRGSIIPILDLKKRSMDEFTQMGYDTRILIAQVNEQKIGFLVDEVNEIIEFNNQVITRSVDILGTIDDQFLDGIAEIDNQLVLLLNIENVI
jgi:purine-binding chemotaxis protein CheW